MRILRLAALLLVAYLVVQAQSPRSAPMHHATGSFDVKVTPLESSNKEDATIARYSLEKQFHGALEGASKGEMLASGNPASDAGAVAMEKVTGKLDGRSGSFVLQHHGVMLGGKPQHWTVEVVPGSGTDALQGLAGTMQIIIEGKQHSYVFDYTLPEK